MVHEVQLESAPSRFAEGAFKFEAGTPNVAAAIGLAAAVRFLESLGREEVMDARTGADRVCVGATRKSKGTANSRPNEIDRANIGVLVCGRRTGSRWTLRHRLTV